MPHVVSYQRILAFILLCILSSGYVNANSIDSLTNLYKATADPNQRAIIAYQILAKTFNTNPSLAGYYLFDATRDSTSVENANLANCFKGLSIVYYFEGKYDSAILFANNALRRYSALKNDLEVVKMLKNRALSFSGKGNYAEAIQDYLKSLEFIKKTGDTTLIAGSLNDIGNSYSRLKNFDEALKFQREALSYLRGREPSQVLGNVLNSIGYIYNVGGINNDTAIHYYNASLKVKEKHANIYSIVNTKNNLCSCYNLDVRMTEFITCFNDLLKLQLEVNDQTGITRSHLNLATGYRKKGHYAKANHHQKQALLYGQMVGDPELLAEVYLKATHLFQAQGLYREALEAHQHHLALKDSIFYSRRNEVTQEMAAKYEFEKKNREIAETSSKLATAENKRLLGEISIRSRNFWIGGLSMMLLVGLATATAFTQRLRRKKETEKSAAVLAERDRGLKAIIDAQEDERIRIARELHDGIGNNLLALQMQLRSIPESGEEASRKIQSIMEDVRTVSHEMMPKVLQEFGCVPAIRDMLERVLRPSGIEYTFETHHTENKKYDKRIETAIYRIAQELINNVVKHSGADQVTVQLIETGGTLVLFVEDNGKGIGSSATSEGIGMENIRTRLSAINGGMHISQGEESGTVASIRIPLT